MVRILTVRGGGGSAKDAQGIKGKHMQQKNHLPSRGVVIIRVSAESGKKNRGEVPPRSSGTEG